MEETADEELEKLDSALKDWGFFQVCLFKKIIKTKLNAYKCMYIYAIYHCLYTSQKSCVH